MPRCRSWRPTRVGLQTPQSSAPGTDRRQWRRCRAKVEPGQVRCAECARALVEHPDVEVRRMVAMGRIRTKGRPGGGVQAWLDEATDVPRAGLPDEKWSKRARWHRRYVRFSAYAVLPVLLLAVFAVFGRPMAPAGAGDSGVVAG